MIRYVFLALYLVAGTLNVCAAKKSNRKLFSATKPLLLPMLCLYCLFCRPDAPDLLLIAALFACWLGDVLLMPEGDAWFVIGGVVFFAGHVLFIFNFARCVDLTRLPLAAVVPAAAVYAAAAGYVMYRVRKDTPAPMRIPMLLYLLCNAVTNLFALSYLIQYPGLRSAVSYAGAALFFLSDCALFLMRSDTGKKSFFKTDCFVMLTYISGVLLITLGLSPAA